MVDAESARGERLARRRARRNSPNGSPTAFPIFSAAIVNLYTGVRRSSSALATRPATRCSNSLRSRKSIRARRFSGRHAATDLARIFSGGDADQLPARGELGADVQALVESGRVTLLTGFAVVALTRESDRVVVEGATANGPRRIGPVDRIIAATGQRPDLATDARAASRSRSVA